MGRVTKVVLQFREPFWQDRWFRRRPTTRGLGDLCFIHAMGEAFPTWWTAAPVTAPLLTGWAGGPRAAELPDRDPDSVATTAVQSLARILGVSLKKLRPLLVATHFHDWQHDPLSRGAYSYVPVGASDARKKLAAPVAGTLFFAGEASHFAGQAGTVAGAIATGRRAADQVWNRRK
jgi:monoamine oxidase